MITLLCACGLNILAQDDQADEEVYVKRVLESVEVDLLSSYYSQTGDNAAVTGGIGTEELTDATATIVVSIPLSDIDVLTIDTGISAYTSASSSNINPFDGRNNADAFIASSGESTSDTWSNANVSFSHSSDDRNKVWSAKASFANEYDYTSIGVGGSYAMLFNEKNTELGFHGSVYLDQWSLLYPIELRRPSIGGIGYNPSFTRLNEHKRNSYSGGINFSQILSQRMQGSLAMDVTVQKGLLSTPFQRVYFGDRRDVFRENFHLADDIERLPGSRTKLALGGRLNYYVNEYMSLRTFYRYYFDDWGVTSHTASIEMPIKFLEGRLTAYPSFRYYNQSAADYFAPYNTHESTSQFYTSDYDLSQYTATQWGIGLSYTDVFQSVRLWKLGLKGIDLKYYQYDRNNPFRSEIVTLGLKFVID